MSLPSKLTVAFAIPMALLSVASSASAAAKSPKDQLQETLSGYTAGEPVNCIPQYAIQSVRIFDKTALLYEMNGDKYYLNIPDTGANDLDDRDVLVTENWTSQLCNVDIVKLWDPGSRMVTGFVGLGKFIPYTRTREYK